MTELTLALLTWIAAETGLLTPPPPAVVRLPESELSERVSGNRDVLGLYDHETRTIYLRADWSASDLRDRATLLHELVHHVQHFNAVPAACRSELEPQAYDLTLRWLRQQGAEDPYRVLDTDEFAIVLRSICWDE